MKTRNVDFPTKDTGLRDDVRLLGALVGDVIREQGGEDLFALVEGARVAAIRRREGDPAAGGRLEKILASPAPADAALLVRGFSTYFQVVNLAEKVHRIRRRRDYLRANGSPQRDGIEDTFIRLHEAGLDASEIPGLLDRLRVEPVFTAHPTESTRRIILEKHQRIARRLVERLDPSRTPQEERAAIARIRAEVTSAWQTEEHPAARPTVLDELEHVLFYVTDILYRVIPVLYESLDATLARVYGPDDPLGRIPTLVRFASWVGGDMDGNPNVSATTIRLTLARHRDLILGLYRREVVDLSRQLSQSPSRVPIDEDVLERLRSASELLPDVHAAVPPRHRDMPYSVLLRLMASRLEATGGDAPGGYGSCAEFLDDLKAIAESLKTHKGEHAGLFAVRRTIRRAEAFGFHLATLDVRQDAGVHRAVVGRALGDAGWADLSADRRVARLSALLASDTLPPPESDDEETRRTLDVFRAIGECRKTYGPHAVGPYITSMTRGADDILSVLLLARWAGLCDASGAVPIDVSPLFETVPDLEAAGPVMASVVSDPCYRSHLANRGDRQIVMIGYSDSNKEGGLASARWALQRAQAILVDSLSHAGIRLTVFHGRGGTISRGGGKTRRAVLSAPRGSVAGHLRVTEQGEIINAKYGLRSIALRTLERAVGALATRSARPRPPDDRQEAWRKIMTGIAASSRAAYRSLVIDHPAFTDYFRRATPIDIIEKMPIGSRPAARRPSGGIESLRAIPWVFAWTQSRHLLPGWYGLGTALREAADRHGDREIAAMVREWPFLRALIEDAEMVLAKADMPIAERYAELAGETGREVFPLIRSEFDRTVEIVLRLKGSDALLDDDPTLQRSIRLRNPYVDPMSLLQVNLLRRWREADRPEGDLFKALLATVNGIAQGLQNTG